MGKDVHFDSSSGINQQSCPRTDVQICVMLCTVKWGRMTILTVPVVLTSNLVHVQMCKFARYAVYSCGVRWGRVPIFYSFSFVNQQYFHPRSSRICVVLCTVLEVYDESCPFWCFQWHHNPTILSQPIMPHCLVLRCWNLVLNTERHA